MATKTTPKPEADKPKRDYKAMAANRQPKRPDEVLLKEYEDARAKCEATFTAALANWDHKLAAVKSRMKVSAIPVEALVKQGTTVDDLNAQIRELTAQKAALKKLTPEELEALKAAEDNEQAAS